jgi:glutamate carboxypeptidase
MKGGDVIIFRALKALKSIGALDTLNDHGGDDRRRGGCRPATRGRAQSARDAAKARRGDWIRRRRGDPAHCRGRAGCGSTSWKLEVTGVTGHSSQIFGPDLGAGAIYEASRIPTNVPPIGCP